MKIALMLEIWARRIGLALFYILNKYRFKRLDLRAMMTKPLRVEGSRYISILSGAKIKPYVWLAAIKLDEHDPDLTIGEGCSIGDFSHLVAVRKVVLGKHVLTANGVYITDNLHGFQDIHTPIMHQPVQFKSEVTIGDGSWLGENVCVIGAKIGKNCVIGANAVVTKDIPDYSVAVGCPAKVIRRYDVVSEEWLAVG